MVESRNTLVVYFSATGNTKKVAGYIAEAAGADLFEPEPKEPCTSADLDWTVTWLSNIRKNNPNQK